MTLKTSSVHRRLDAKLKIGGMEALDLIFVLTFAAVMNLLFGRMSFGFIFVGVAPLGLLFVLIVGKRNKPEGYLLHLIRYLLTPGFYSAAEESSQEEILREKIYEK